MVSIAQIKYFFIVFTIYFFVFQDYISNHWISIVKYGDELIAAVLFLVVLCMFVKKDKLDRWCRQIFLCYVFIIICGFISTSIHMFQPFENAFIDFVVNVKFVGTLLGSICIYYNFDLKKYAKRISFHVKILVIILLSLTILDGIFNLFPSTYYRLGRKSLCLIYTHPSTLVVVCFLLMSTLFFVEKYGIKSNFYKIILAIIIILTLRSKGIGALALFAIIYCIVELFHSHISIKKLILLSPLILALGWTQIEDYYLINQYASRLLLTKYSIVIAKDMFPFGTGFATYGSAYSVEPYSPVYSIYGMESYWGISISAHQDITDTFWPMILGEFGIIALIMYLIVIILLLFKIQSFVRIDKNFYLSLWCVFSYLIVASTSESTFVNSYAVFFAIVMSVVMYNKDSIQARKGKKNIKKWKTLKIRWR